MLSVPAYRRSPALDEWRTSRRASIDELRRVHSVVGRAGPGSGPGRPPKAGTQQINEALVLRIVSEFQGFSRDLFDLATSKLVRAAGCARPYQAQLITAASRERWLDRGNPHLENISNDAARLGIAQVRSRLVAINPRHSSDAERLRVLVELRNALAHDDQDKLTSLSRDGVRPTMQYVTQSVSVLGRHAAALDRVMWDHLLGLFPTTDPWSA